MTGPTSKCLHCYRCLLFHDSLKEDPVFAFRILALPRALGGVFLLLLLTLAACGTTFQAAASGGGPVQVVAAESFWRSIAGQVGVSHVRGTSLIVDPTADPDSHAPTAADARTPAD